MCPDRVEESPKLVETHISTLFFLGDRVYKLKKPVRFDFVDLSERATRERICHREVELNRRLSPDIYLGVLDVFDEDGRPRDHLVEMRRLPSGRRLSTLIEEGVDVDGCLRAVARELAAFHAAAETSEEILQAGGWEAVRRNWSDNLEEMDRFAGEVLDRRQLDGVRSASERYLAGRRTLFEARADQGHVRDGHGDLSTDDIFCLDDGPRVLDCIEFDDRFRYADVVADIAFLAMHLERLDRGDLAGRFVDWYREFSGETAPDSLVHHYVAYRAIVRSKVACLRAEQSDGEGTDEARRLLSLADDHLERGRVRLVCVGGLPGTGKSTLSEGIVDETGWTLLRSDEIRKDLADVAHTDHPPHDFGEGIYSEEMTERTYRELLDRAASLLERGESVVLDASWTRERRRAGARRLAGDTSSDLVELTCVLPTDRAAGRLRDRRDDVSDADVEVASKMETVADPWPEAIEVSTEGPPEGALTQALSALSMGARDR